MPGSATTPLHHRIASCLLASLVTSATFHRIASRFFSAWLPPVFITTLAVLIIVCAIVCCFAWPRLERRYGAQPLLIFWQSLLCYSLALDFSLFGWQKIFGMQFITPLGMLDEPFSKLTGEWLTWSYFGRSYPMIVAIALFQITGALLLLSDRTRLIGVFIVLPILTNILLIDIFYGLPPGVIVHAVFLMAGITYLLFCDYDRLVVFFLREKSMLNIIPLSLNGKRILRIAIAATPLLLIASAPSPDKHPELTGKYRVSKIQIDGNDVSAQLNRDSVLTVVYFDLSNDCVFEFRDYRQRFYGTYTYSPATHAFNTHWHYPRNSNAPFMGTLTRSAAGHLRLNGTIRHQTVVADLERAE